MFSIIIPLYNKERYILDTLESVISQSYSEFEVVIVNDGSTDDSLSIVNSIFDKRIKVFSKVNGGVSSARNYGIEQASFSYICFLDADDLWEKGFLMNMKDMVESLPKCSIYSTAFVMKKSDSEVINSLPEREGRNCYIIDDYCQALLKYKVNICWSGTICVLKEAIEACGTFPLDIKRGEDIDTWLRVISKYKLGYSTNALAIYNYDAEGNTNSRYFPVNESFPYWKWRKYDYKPQKSLYDYSNYMIIQLIRRAIRFKKIHTVIFLILKLKWTALFRYMIITKIRQI